MKHTFTFHGHIAKLYSTGTGREMKFNATGPECPTCSLPFVIAESMEFMAIHSIHSLVVDGVEITHTITSVIG